MFTMAHDGAGANAPSLQDKIQFLPAEFKADDWQEPTLYAYFAVNYFDEDIFNVIVNKANKFKNARSSEEPSEASRAFEELRSIFAGSERSFDLLSSGSANNLTKIRLNQLAFEAALDKEYIDIASHFI